MRIENKRASPGKMAEQGALTDGILLFRSEQNLFQIGICIHYLSNKNKNSFQTILNLYLKSEYVALFYWCLGRIDIGLHQI